MAAKLIFSEEEKQTIISLYQAGTSLRQLEKELGHTRKTLSKLLKEENVTIKDNTINSRRYQHQEDYFKIINTEDKAYWLGFIYADGFIESKRKHGAQKLGITLSNVDKEHLVKFKTAIKATNPVLDYQGSGYNQAGMFSKILLTSNQTVDDLKALGVIENKTYDLTFPDFIDESLLHHFVRGYFDGDGSINYYTTSTGYRKYQIGFTGSLEMIEGLNKFFNKECSIRKKGNAYQVNYGGVNEVHKILERMYDHATVCLDRKKVKVDDFIKNMVKTRV